MRLIIRLAGKEIDFIQIPIDKENTPDFLLVLSKELLVRNANLIGLSHTKPEFYLERPTTSIHTFMKNINGNAKLSLN